MEFVVVVIPIEVGVFSILIRPVRRFHATLEVNYIFCAPIVAGSYFQVVEMEFHIFFSFFCPCIAYSAFLFSVKTLEVKAYDLAQHVGLALLGLVIFHFESNGSFMEGVFGDTTWRASIR